MSYALYVCLQDEEKIVAFTIEATRRVWPPQCASTDGSLGGDYLQ